MDTRDGLPVPPAHLLLEVVEQTLQVADRMAAVDQGVEIRLRGAACYAAQVAELLTYEDGSGEAAEKAAALHDLGMVATMGLADGRAAAGLDTLQGRAIEAAYRLASGARMACRGTPGRHEVRHMAEGARLLLVTVWAQLTGDQLREGRRLRSMLNRRPVERHEVETVWPGDRHYATSDDGTVTVSGPADVPAGVLKAAAEFNAAVNQERHAEAGSGVGR